MLRTAVAARVHGALSSVLLQHAAYRETLLQQHGFTVLDVRIGGRSSLHNVVVTIAARRGTSHGVLHVARQVRMSPDNLTAYVLWEASPEHQEKAAIQLARK